VTCLDMQVTNWRQLFCQVLLVKSKRNQRSTYSL
jgi:hypothetical protein